MNDPKWPPDIADRMFRAVELVEERLRRAMAALTAEAIPAAVIGAKAVAHWVATRDEGAVRNTPNVDILVRPDDAGSAQAALERAGFVRSGVGTTPMVFLDGPEGKVRQAVQVWLAGDVVKPGTEPLPDLECPTDARPFRVVTLTALVRMKLSAFRRIDSVHLRDMVGVGVIDDTWPDRYPPPLAARLREILADPDG